MRTTTTTTTAHIDPSLGRDMDAIGACFRSRGVNVIRFIHVEPKPQKGPGWFTCLIECEQRSMRDVILSERAVPADLP